MDTESFGFRGCLDCSEWFASSYGFQNQSSYPESIQYYCPGIIYRTSVGQSVVICSGCGKFCRTGRYCLYCSSCQDCMQAEIVEGLEVHPEFQVNAQTPCPRCWPRDQTGEYTDRKRWHQIFDIESNSFVTFDGDLKYRKLRFKPESKNFQYLTWVSRSAPTTPKPSRGYERRKYPKEIMEG